MAIAHVESAGAIAGYTSASVSVAFPTNVAVGDLILVVGWRYSDTTDAYVVGDCTKSAGTATIDTIVLDASLNLDMGGGAGFGQVGIWSCLVTGAGSLTMQLAGGATTAPVIAISRYTGSFDSARAEASSTNSTATDNTTPGHSGDATSAGAALFIGGIGVGNPGATLTVTPDGAFTQIYENEDGATSQVGSAIYRLVGSGTTDRAEWTLPTSNNNGYVAALVVYKEAGPAAEVDQQAFRFGADDGSESAHTWLAAQDADVTAPLGQNILLRMQVAVDGAFGALTPELRYLKNAASGAYAPVPVGSGSSEAYSLPTWGAVGTGGSGTTSCTPSYPTGISAATSKLFCVVTGRSNTANTVPTMPAGWTRIGGLEGGTGTWGVDTGTRRVDIFQKDTTLGTETGTVTVSLSGTTANTLRATIHRIEVASGYGIDVELVTGADTTNGTGYSATASANATFDSNRLVLIAVAQCIDTGTQSAQSITASGITFGTRTNRAGTAVTNGNDHRHIVDTVPVSSGSGTVAPTYAYTISANGSGPTAFLVLRGRLPAVVNEVYVSPSANWNYNGGEDTTARLTPPAGSPSYSFVQGRRWDDENGTDSVTLNDLQYTEVEWSLQAQSPATNGDVFEFALFRGGSIITPTSGFPQWTIGTAGLSIAAERGRLVFRGREVGLSLTSALEIDAERGRLTWRGRTVPLASVQPAEPGRIVWRGREVGLQLVSEQARGRLVFRGREVGLALQADLTLTAERGQVRFRGREVGLTIGANLTLAAQPGRVVWRGRQVGLALTNDLLLGASPGRIVYRGRQVGLTIEQDLFLTADRGRLVWRGREVGLTATNDLFVAAARGRVAWRGRQVGLALTADLFTAAQPGRIVYRGRNIGLTITEQGVLPVAPGRIVYRGREVGLALEQDLALVASPGRIAYRGRNVGLTVTADLFATVQAGRVVYRGRNVGLTITEGLSVTASPGRIAYRGREVGLSLQQELPLPVSRGRIRWAGRDAGLSLTADQFLAAEVGRLVWRGRDVGLDITLDISIQTERGRITWRGRDVGLSFGGAVLITAEPGRLAWRGREVGLQIAAAAAETVLDPKFSAKRRYQNIQIRGIEKARRKKRIDPDLPAAAGQEPKAKLPPLLSGLFGRAGITAEPAPFVVPAVLPPAPTPVSIAPTPVVRRPPPAEPEEPEPLPAPEPPPPPVDPVEELRGELAEVQAQLAITKAEMEDRIRETVNELQGGMGDLMDMMRAEREAAQARIRDLEQQIERERKRAQQQRAAALAAARLLRE